ncbi:MULTISPECIES: Holliday junction resolvase RuvX [unclassified Undibacterium]|uniref:Holliday junction resolvase RuvX n=1 Tax=unclassified Undibacterium TaxID=2630295 RepID=UPI001331CFA7|nr:Holliday junction resolvase RuvX [Undibacterium sp. KW1]BBB59148.1 putative pre-16S rRNA nuclease [Undibacterium sp. KW1]
MAASEGTVLAFDFGLKRIGVAVGNTFLRQAEALSIIHAPTNDGKFADITKLIEKWQPVLCVVGLPMHPDGADNEMTQRCKRFANQLNGRFNLPAVLVDERYSSAVLSGSRGEFIDDDAAALILQQYFDETP